MKSTTMVCVFVAASFGLSSLSFAQGNDWNNGHGNGHDNQRRSAPAPDNHDRHGNAPRYDARPDPRYAYRLDQRDGRWNERRTYYNARGPEFQRGHYIPREYRSRQYVVNNYYSYRLPPPPRNHEWVQVGADYVLIAIATGLIAQIVLGH